MKKKLSILFTKLILASLIFYGLSRSAQLEFKLYLNFLYQPQFVFLILTLFLIMVGAGAWRWHKLNSDQGITLGFFKTIKPTYIGIAFNNLLPGAVGGDFVRGYYLYKYAPDKKDTVLLTIFFDRLLGLLGILLLICGIACLNVPYLGQEHVLLYLLIITIIACLTIVALLFGILIFPHRLGLITWLNNHYSHYRIIKSMLSFFESVSSYRIQSMTIFQGLLVSLLIQVFIVIILQYIAQLLELPAIAFGHYALAVGITQIVSLIPITPGGIGVGESAFANILLLLNPTIDAPFASIFLAYRLLSIATYLPAVLFYLPKLNPSIKLDASK